MGKWVLKGLEPGVSPLHQLLRHRLSGLRPPGPVHWPKSLQFTLLHRFSAPRGSQLWNRLVQAWRHLSPLVDAVPPRTFEEVQNTHLWWTTHFIGQNFGFSEARANQLAHSGLSCLQDLWEPGTTNLRPWPELCQAYGLHDAERAQIDSYQQSVPAEWLALRPGLQDLASPRDWLGVFDGDILEDPLILFQATPHFCPRLGPGGVPLHIPPEIPTFLLGRQSRRLLLALDQEPPLRPYVGTVRRVRVLLSPSGSRPRAKAISRYLAPLSCLSFDPARWLWRPGDELYWYSARKGCLWRNPRLTLSLPISVKWAGLVPGTYTPDWQSLWSAARPRKEAGFLWSFYHKAIAVNKWRHRSHPLTSAACPACDQGPSESLLHCFFECPAARLAWDWAQTVLYALAGISRASMPWPRFSWDQCLMGTALPDPLRAWHDTWSLIRGTTLWCIWLRRNAVVFRNEIWSTDHLDTILWDATLDLARLSWERVKWSERYQPRARPKLRRDFTRLWAHRNVFCSLQADRVTWLHVRPRRGVFS
ncbi:hypothetical protein KC19_VG052100 [Ceratodon purpureus]|uniref:Reverse transcriptase zinc-binding domain-containing protein n=1 Tax=Ceratodon purpureus TaxID=3225 RepID=A0A8T0HM84_CERPU|nr:hypothetical protein KC19_VG052100 [Ceratodon purpureus]